MQNLNTAGISQRLLLQKLTRAKCIVDATAGNGNDTLFLTLHSPAGAQVYAFDIQQEALNETRRKLAEADVENKARLFLAGHETIDEKIAEPIDVAVFNLGYLPGADHSVTTKTSTTLEAIQKTLALMGEGALLSVTLYPGHAEGALECRVLTEYFTALPTWEFSVVCCFMKNHKNSAPQLYMIEKVRG